MRYRIRYNTNTDEIILRRDTNRSPNIAFIYSRNTPPIRNTSHQILRAIGGNFNQRMNNRTLFDIMVRTLINGRTRVLNFEGFTNLSPRSSVSPTRPLAIRIPPPRRNNTFRVFYNPNSPISPTNMFTRNLNSNGNSN